MAINNQASMAVEPPTFDDRPELGTSVTPNAPGVIGGENQEYYQPSQDITTPTVTAGNEYVTPEATVSGQLSSILEQGSPLLTLAESRANDEAQRRGLLSSSMAVGAGQKALYDTALPIAQQDAQTFGQFGLAQQQAENRLLQTGYEGDITGVLEGYRGDIQGELAREAYASQETIANNQIASDMTKAAWANATQIYNQQISVESQERIVQFQESEAGKRLTQELANRMGISELEAQTQLTATQMQIEAEIETTDMRLQNDILTTAMQLDSQERQTFISNASQLIQNANNAKAQVQMQPDSQVSPEQKEAWNAIVDTQLAYDLDMVGGLAGYEFISADSTVETGGTNTGTGGYTRPTPETTPESTPEPTTGFGSGSGSGNYGQDYVPSLGL